MLDPDIQKLLDLVPSGSEAAFPPEEFARRQAALRERMAARGIDLYLTSGPENVFYLSGQQTPGLLHVPVPGDPGVRRAVPRAARPRVDERAGQHLPRRHQRLRRRREPGGRPGRGAQGRAAGRASASPSTRTRWFLTVNLYQRLIDGFGPLLDALGARRAAPPREVAARAPSRWRRPAAPTTPACGRPRGHPRRAPRENDIAAAIMARLDQGGRRVCRHGAVRHLGAALGHPAHHVAPPADRAGRRRDPGDLRLLQPLPRGALPDGGHAARSPTRRATCTASARRGWPPRSTKLRPGNTCADVHKAAQAVIDRHGYTAGYRKRTGYSIGHLLRARLGRGQHPEPLPRRRRARSSPAWSSTCRSRSASTTQWTVAVSETVLVTPDGGRRLSTLPAGLLER